MHGRRAFAAAAAAGLLLSLFAPWYRETVVAPGLHGLRTLTLTRSGWQAFSATELVILVVAVLTLIVAIAMPWGVPGEGGRDRRRVAGAIVAVLGAIAFVVVLARLTTAPGTTKHAIAETMVAIRWGIFLALVCSAALTAAGLRLITAARPVANPAEGTDPAARASRRQHAPRSPREPRPGRTPRQDRAPRGDRARSAATRTDGPAPAAPAPERRPERARPARRSDRPLWDEQATGWVDLPE
jgi:MFS family permease